MKEVFMASGTAKITRFSLSIRPVNKSNPSQKRIISLDTEPLTGDQITLVFIEFHNPPPSSNGRFSSGFANVKVDLAHYADMLHLLQTEAPVEVDIRSDSRDEIEEFRIGMPQPGGQEPPGEGLADSDA